MTPRLDLTNYIEIGDCHEWQGPFGAKNKSGQPIAKYRNEARQTRNAIVAREVWERERGPIQAGRIIYRHCCNDACINVEHLRCGKRGDQLKRRAAMGLMDYTPDRIARQAQVARGRATTKNTEAQAQRVREMAADGLRDADIAVATGVSEAMVADIRRGKAWLLNAPQASVFTWRPA